MALLTEVEAIRYLLARQAISEADVVLGEILVTNITRRNCNFAVRVNSGRGFFLKQDDPMQSLQTLRREAAIYAAMTGVWSDFAGEHLPEFHWFDPDNGMLALGYLDGVRAFRACDQESAELTKASAFALGRALARLHRRGSAPWGLPDAPRAWASAINEPGPEAFTDYSSAAIDVIKIIQSTPHLAQRLEGAGQEPITNTPIHGDIRWDNILIRSARTEDSVERLFIVDWEIAGVGDPARDIGGVFAEYLASWLRAIPNSPSTRIHQSLGLAPCRLEHVQAGIRRFWKAYCGELGEIENYSSLLSRATEVCGTRLVQSAFELAQSSVRITGTVVYILQAAQNILSDPDNARRTLLTVPQS